MNLFEIAAQYRDDCDKLASLDLDDQTFSDTLQSLSGDIEEKAANIAALIGNLDAMADAIYNAEKAMMARRRVLEKKADRLREYLITGMQAAGIKNFDTPHFTIHIKFNPASVVIDDISLIPNMFMHQPESPPPEPKKRAIADAINAGRSVPGAHLERKERLEIK